ncbi:hypothetical protein KC326_g96 [Hortaea werneckii]|nr:hypothetical protein KC326_g96 [Hortaea werneckii]
MSKVHTLLDMRKLAEKEEQELRKAHQDTHISWLESRNLPFWPGTATSNAVNDSIKNFAAPYRLMTAQALISMSLQQLVAADPPAGATWGFPPQSATASR